MNNIYYYFATHTINQSIYNRLQAGATYKTLDEDSRGMLDKLTDKYPQDEFTESPTDYCSKFIIKHKTELYELEKLKGADLKYFLVQYLGFVLQWGASTRAFGKNSKKRAETITGQELIKEMTDSNGTIKKLLDSSGGNVTAVKPFLPAIMISLFTNTRKKSIMEFKHTGEFCFDFDGLKDSNEARFWMNKVWGGTTNIKPYMAFISPRGKGFKVFCRVDKTNPDFIRDFGLEERAVVMKHHKVWYEGAHKELIKFFPELTDKFDISTNDPQRLTYLPYIDNSSLNFKYSATNESDYSLLVNSQRADERKDLLKKISKNAIPIAKIMKEQGITSQEDAYHLYIKNLSPEFDLEYETEKFIQVIDFIEELSFKDDRVSNWVYEKFNDYHTLHKMSWVLYGVFGDLAIDQLKRLIPAGSNKLDESGNDYRWAIRSKEDYDQDQLATLNPGAFYQLVLELGEVKNFLSEKFGASSRNVSDFKIINSYYEIYQRNVELHNNDNDQANLNEFLDRITSYIDEKKIRLPLIEELETIPAEITLGHNEYLDKDVMHNLFQKKYADKRIFSLRSQCGSGKNTLAGHPDYKIKGRVILAEPYKGISNQIAKQAWDEENRPEQLFVNSDIEHTVKSFKKEDKEEIRINYEKTLKGKDLPKSDNLVVHCTYDQVLNLSHRDMATFNYIFIDESHTLSDGLDYRAEVISKLIHHIIEFVAKKRTGKTKIIFMSGTPNVETHAIPEIMEHYQIKSLFQRVIVHKKYKKRPLIHLTHLDTNDSSIRFDEVVNQINKYLKEGRKVFHLFNNKLKMDEYIREIQIKLSSSIKIGLFYSGSEGECTQNILSGKFGDFDVVLATTFFINGINIDKDGLSEDEVKQGKTSTQKYGIIIDLGNIFTKVNAMGAVQAINRFRNRECHSTVFFPKIFKPNLKDTAKKFNFGNAVGKLLGINKYNYHLLSANEDATPNELTNEEEKEEVHLLAETRKNPINVSLRDITAFADEDENKKLVVRSITEKARIYEDWFCSLDGYHYLAKDAGFASIIKHTYIGSPLKEMTKDQVELENNLIRNFLDDEKAMNYLERQINPEKRILVRASNRVLDPISTEIGNFEIIAFINDKYILEGDFHSSHERAVNQLINYHLRLCYWYGPDKAIELLRFLINPKADLQPSKSSSYLKNINKYVNSCNSVQDGKLINAINYIKAIDSLSKKELGVIKKVKPNYISYTVTDADLVNNLKNMWAKQQHEIIMYKLDVSQSPEKEELKKYYSKTELIKKIDLEELATQLNKLSNYTPLKCNKKGNIKTYETIVIPRIIRSPNLGFDMDIEIDEFSEPSLSTVEDNANKLKQLAHDNKRKLKAYLEPLIKANNASAKKIYSFLSDKLNKKEIQNSIKYIDSLINDPVKSNIPNISNILNRLKIDLSNWNDLLLTFFKTSEYTTYKELKNIGFVPFVYQTFFCAENFKLESLDAKFTSMLKNIKEEDVFNSLKRNSKLFKNSRRSKVSNNSNKTTLGKSNETKASYVVLNKKGDIIYTDFSLSKTCEFLCKYAYKNEGFVMKDASTPPKVFNKSIYNAGTFKRDYYSNSSTNKTVANYIINTYEVNVQDYIDYVNPPKIKTLPKSKGKAA